MDPSDKKASYEIWNYSLRSSLQFALFKIKIRLLESDHNAYVMGVVQNHFYHSMKEITQRKNIFLEKYIYYGTLDILTNIMM